MLDFQKKTINEIELNNDLKKMNNLGNLTNWQTAFKACLLHRLIGVW